MLGAGVGGSSSSIMWMSWILFVDNDESAIEKGAEDYVLDLRPTNSSKSKVYSSKFSVLAAFCGSFRLCFIYFEVRACTVDSFVGWWIGCTRTWRVARFNIGRLRYEMLML